jgi:hypothetical protein
MKIIISPYSKQLREKDTPHPKKLSFFGLNLYNSLRVMRLYKLVLKVRMNW